MTVFSVVKFIIGHPLNRGNKVKALVDFIKWQISSRLIPGEGIVYDWLGGARFLVRPGETGLTGNIYTGLHEFADMLFLLHVLRDDELFVDVGANVGSYTILACSVVGARGYAFEPVPSTYKRLIDNIRLNYLDSRVNCNNVCIGSEKGTVAFTNDLDTENHAVADGDECNDQIMVDVTTLDSALKDEQPALIKIDVEGYESLVISGALEILSNPTLHSVIMELNGSGGRYGFDESEILTVLSEKGFRPYSYNPFKRKLMDLEGKNVESGNTIFIRDKELVSKRLHDANKININGNEI